MNGFFYNVLHTYGGTLTEPTHRKATTTKILRKISENVQINFSSLLNMSSL